MRWSWQVRFTWRDALAAMALFWVIGAVLLLVAWRASAAEDRIRDAPFCTAGQVFTATECRFTLDGTMTGLTSDRAEMDVDGRHFSVNVTLAGTIHDVAGLPVKVTLYRGKPIHVEGPDLRYDTDDAPATSARDFRNWGLSAIVGGTILSGFNLVIALFGRPRKQPA